MFTVLVVYAITNFVASELAIASLPIQVPVQPPMDVLDPVINRLLARLSIEQRIGQLMLVTFKGSTVVTESAVAKLIRDYHIGGVMLLANNDNFDGSPSAPNYLLALTNTLQQINYGASLNDNGQPSLGYVPLFIAMSNEGDSTLNAQIVSGTTRLPSNMAIGATWNPDHAQHVGNIVGKELSAMGINLLFGPSLDVQPALSPDTSISLERRSFGGEPWWVGHMAQAYVIGARAGSGGRLIIVPRDFPGLGASDRQPEREIPVVPRTAEELARTDLMPYFTVTGHAENIHAVADGLQCANIRYQGQNIRTVTRPTCIDEQALGDLLHMEGFGDWHTNGGMIVSDSLGTRAIRRWYGQLLLPHRQITREALLAGNDVLLLHDFGPNPGDKDFDNIVDVIGFFTKLYKSDPLFKARVDQSVRRILRQKLEAYGGDLSIENVKRSPNNLTVVGQNSAELYTIARDAVTLLAPAKQRLGPPPSDGQNILVFTDLRYGKQCSTCDIQPIISVDALEESLIRLYGPAASNQVKPTNIKSFTFSQLNDFLTSASESTLSSSKNMLNLQLADVLSHADWIIFNMLDMTSEFPGSRVVQDFLEVQPTMATKAYTVVMAFGAPGYLSSTDISKLSAYYGIYSTIPPFIDGAARALFQEISYQGYAPVSLPAISYDVIRATSPDPSQVIRIVPTRGDGVVNSAGNNSATPGPLPTTSVGANLQLRTEPILDRNGHIVPDGTPVTFTLSFVTEGVQRQQDSITRSGIAQTSFTLSRPGQIQITAASIDATRSVTFQITVGDNNKAALLKTIEPPVSTNTPLPTPTMTYTPTLMPSSTSIPLSSVTAVAAVMTPASPIPSPHTITTMRVGPRDFVAAFIGLLIMALLGFATNWQITRSIDHALRVSLSCALGGLIGYISYATGVPGVDTVRAAFPGTGALFITLLLALPGLLIGWQSTYRITRR